MPRDPSYVAPQPFDPLGALIYYLCVTRAIETGGLILPSSQFVASELELQIVEPGSTRAKNDRVQTLWEDLVWMNEQHLLFNEEPHPPGAFFRVLSQHNVNQRIRQFPGIE